MKLMRTLLPALMISTLVGLAASDNDTWAQAAQAGRVDEARVRAETANGNDWLLNGRDFGERHFSPLKQVNAQNVAQLGLAWSLDIDSAMGMSAEPIEVDGVIYVSAPRSLVYAVDAVSGKVLWKADPNVKLGYSTQNSYAVRVNRGVAVWKGKVYVSTGDCRLVAMDAATGHQLWSSQICDPEQTGSTGAPHIAKDKVLIGYNGSDDMIRGSITAFDANSGKEVWRFWTVPGDPSKPFESKALEKVVNTWSGDRWWRFGGGDVWDAIDYDPATNLVIFGDAGSGQVEGTTPRSAMPQGAKLFAGCVVAVNADTGEYVWHFQTSGDHFQTENFHIIITDLTLNGERRHVAIEAPRNGFIYVLDAKTGHLIEAKPYGTVHWASSVDLKTGRPVENMEAIARGRAFRGAGKTWWPMSYNPITGLVYIPAYDVRTHAAAGQTPLDGKLVAWDPVSQSVRWSVEQPIQTNGGVLSTAGNLVFQGEGTGLFSAFAADTGHKLWSIQTGSAIDAVPITYRVGGEQYVLIPVGWGLGLAAVCGREHHGNAKIQARAGPSAGLQARRQRALPDPARCGPGGAAPARSHRHPAGDRPGWGAVREPHVRRLPRPGLDGSGAWTVDGAVPDLKYAPAEVHQQWDAIVLGGSHRENGMMAFGVEQHYPDITALTPEQSTAIHAYVIDEAWKAYNEQLKERP